MDVLLNSCNLPNRACFIHSTTCCMGGLVCLAGWSEWVVTHVLSLSLGEKADRLRCLVVVVVWCGLVWLQHHNRIPNITQHAAAFASLWSPITQDMHATTIICKIFHATFSTLNLHQQTVLLLLLIPIRNIRKDSATPLHARGKGQRVMKLARRRNCMHHQKQ